MEKERLKIRVFDADPPTTTVSSAYVRMNATEMQTQTNTAREMLNLVQCRAKHVASTSHKRYCR